MKQQQKRGSAPETGWMERQRRERPDLHSKPGWPKPSPWPRQPVTLDSPLLLILFPSYLLPYSLWSSLCGFSKHQILDTLSHEDFSLRLETPPWICAWFTLSPPLRLCPNVTSLLGPLFPLFYYVLLRTKYCFLTQYVLYLLIMFDCLSSSGLSTAVSPQLAQSKCSLNICSLVTLTWTKTGMSGKKASLGKRRD